MSSRTTRPTKTPPKDLETEKARAFWRSMIAEYGLESFNAATTALLIQAADAIERAEAARVQILEDGAVVTDRFGQPKAHPLIVAEGTARRHAQMGIRELVRLLDGPRKIGRPPGKHRRRAQSRSKRAEELAARMLDGSPN